MASFGQSAFSANDLRNNHTVKVVEHARKQQFAVYVDFYETITLPPHPADSTRTTSKRPLNDVTNTANNDVASKRRRERPPGSKNDQRTSSVNALALYNPTLSESVVVRSRQEIRRSARLASRAPLFSQSLPQEENDDHDFDELFPIRPYADLAGHESDQKFEHASNRDNDEKKKSRLLNRKSKRTYAREIVRQRVRVRRSDLRTRRDDRNLNPDYMAARKKNVVFDKHVLPKLQNEHNNNVCPFCDAYQYDEKCHSKLFDDKYWHCCANDKISPDMMTSEADPDAVAKLPDDPEKNATLQRDVDLKYLNHLLYEMRSTNDPNSPKRLSRRCKKFQKMTITFNNVLSFTSENAKIDELHSVWTTFRIMRSIHHMLSALLADPDDRRRFCQIYSFDSSQEILLERLAHDEQLSEKKLHELQSLMTKYNPYVQSFKSCDDRLKNDDSETKIVLKQHDPKRMLKETHNKPISEKVAVVLSVPEMSNPDKPIERDIVMQIYDDDLIRVPYWHFCYMALRYPLLFPCEEQSWMSTISLLDHENSRDLRARKAPPDATPKSIQKHDLEFDDDEDEKSARDQDEKNDDSDARVGRKESKRVTQREFYSYIIQIRRFLHFSHRSTIPISINFLMT